MTTAKIDSLNLDPAALKHVQDAYLYDDATLASATPGDVAGLPPGLRVRLRAAFPNLAETGNALLADLDDRPAAVAEVVRRLASGDKSPGLLAAAKRLGVAAVARLDGKVSIEATASYVAHLEAGGTVRESWKDHELVSLEELASKVRVSPTDSGELEDGVDPRTGIDWSAMSDEGLAQVRFASKDGMLKGMPDRAVFVAFRDAATNTAEDKALVDRVKRRMKAAKANAEALLRELRQVSSRREDPPPPPPATPIVFRSTHFVARVSQLLSELFDASELSSFVRSNYPSLNAQISWGGSMATTSHNVADTLKRYGYLDGEYRAQFRGAVLQMRPARSRDIDEALR